MSRTWTRAVQDIVCGCCRSVISVGQPLMTIQLSTLDLRRKFPRCTGCAGEPVPTELPAVPRRKSVSELALMMPIKKLAKGVVLPFDYKMAQCREPGSDDE